MVLSTDSAILRGATDFWWLAVHVHPEPSTFEPFEVKVLVEHRMESRVLMGAEIYRLSFFVMVRTQTKYCVPTAVDIILMNNGIHAIHEMDLQAIMVREH